MAIALDNTIPIQARGTDGRGLQASTASLACRQRVEQRGRFAADAWAPTLWHSLAAFSTSVSLRPSLNSQGLSNGVAVDSNDSACSSSRQSLRVGRQGASHETGH